MSYLQPRRKQTSFGLLKPKSSSVKDAIAKAKAKQQQQVPPSPMNPRGVKPHLANDNDREVLHRDGDGFYARFGSKSNPSAKPYVTRIWEVQSARFKPGDISCNCPGWIYNHKCHHTDDVRELLREAKSAPGSLSGLPP